MKTNEILPVLISIVLLVLAALLQKQSKLISAMISTTPIRISLTMWVIYAAVEGSKQEMTQFTQGIIFSLIPTFLFAIGAWLAARAGMKISGILLSGYGTWAISAGILYLLRQTLGIG